MIAALLKSRKDLQNEVPKSFSPHKISHQGGEEQRNQDDRVFFYATVGTALLGSALIALIYLKGQ